MHVRGCEGIAWKKDRITCVVCEIHCCDPECSSFFFAPSNTVFFFFSFSKNDIICLVVCCCGFSSLLIFWDVAESFVQALCFGVVFHKWWIYGQGMTSFFQRVICCCSLLCCTFLVSFVFGFQIGVARARRSLGKTLLFFPFSPPSAQVLEVFSHQK
jgi:hypothetical protein